MVNQYCGIGHRPHHNHSALSTNSNTANEQTSKRPRTVYRSDINNSGLTKSYIRILMNLFRSQSKVASTVTGESAVCTTSDGSNKKDECTVSGLCKNESTYNNENENIDMNYAGGYNNDDVIFRDNLEEQNWLHDLQEGDHIVRWIMLAYCYPVQVHGIVLSAGPELVTIVDCGLTAVKVDKAGTFDEDGKISSRYKSRRRMNVLTLVDGKEIKKWKRIHYGEEYQLRMQSIRNEEGPQFSHKSGAEEIYLSLGYESNSTAATAKTQLDDDDNLEKSEDPTIKQKQPRSFSLWPFYSSQSSCSNLLKQSERSEPRNISSDSTKATPQQQLGNEVTSSSEKSTFRLPKSDPPALVLARLRFLLEHADRDHNRTLLPPHHLFYANSECIAVWIKTGHWSTLQASVFLHSSTIGNVKQTATLAIYLSSQTVTIPAAGIWGFFGGTTTISLFSAQPWIVPALLGGGMVYAGLPTMVLWRAKSRWLETEKNLNAAFWERVDSSVIVALIQTWSGLED